MSKKLDYLLTDKFSNIKAHPFHLVDRSPWPFLAAFSALYLTFGAVMYMHSYVYGGYFLTFGLLGVIYISWLWWRDVIREGTFQGHHSKKVKEGILLGMKLFILSEVFFFFSFFWAFFSNAFAPNVFIGAIWPPVGLHLFNPLEVPLLNTVILLTSSVTVTASHYAIYLPQRKYTKIAEIFLLITIVLGLIFTFFQYVEYMEAPFSINSGIYGSIFFVTTGFHGIHVIIGTIFLIINYIRMLKRHFTYQDHIGYQLAIWYWHFVDVVWIFVYTFLYAHLFAYSV